MELSYVTNLEGERNAVILPIQDFLDLIEKAINLQHDISDDLLQIYHKLKEEEK